MNKEQLRLKGLGHYENCFMFMQVTPGSPGSGGGGVCDPKCSCDKRIDDLQTKLDAAIETLEGFKVGEHICSEANYPGRCSECADNREIDEILLIIKEKE